MLNDRILKVKLKQLQLSCDEFQFELYEWSKIRTDKFLKCIDKNSYHYENLMNFWTTVGMYSEGLSSSWIPIGTEIKTGLITLNFYGMQINPNDPDEDKRCTVVEIRLNDK